MEIWHNPHVRWVSRAVLAVVTGLVLFEAGLIVTDPYLFKGDLQYDSELGFRVRPYAIGSNRFGFSDTDQPLTRTPGVPRVLVLGDSYSWVGGHDCNYTALLRQRLRTSVGRPVEVINTGYPMTGTLEQVKILRRYGLQYRPDVVLLAFFTGNDFSDSDPARKRIAFNGIFADIRGDQDRGVKGFRLLPLWRTRQVLGRFADVRRGLAEGARVAPWNQLRCAFPEGPTMTREAFLEIERHRLFFHLIRPDGTLTFPDRIAAVFNAIDEMKASVESQGGALAVALFPAEVQVDDALFQEVVRDVLEANESEYERDRPQRLLNEFLRHRGIPFVDLIDDFRSAGMTQRLYNEREGHWNLEGNQLAAERIAAFIEPHLAATARPR